MSSIFEQFEILSETGKITDAESLINQQLKEFLKSRDFKNYLEGIGHKVHIFKKFFKATNNPAYLHQILEQIDKALQICKQQHITGHALAVMHLRKGDAFYSLSRLLEALEEHKKAYAQVLADKGVEDFTKAEFLGHLALSKAANGFEDSLIDFNSALSLVRQSNSPSLRPWHRLILETGILLKKAECLKILKKPQTEVFAAIQEAKPKALELLNKYNMKDRQEQLIDLENKK